MNYRERGSHARSLLPYVSHKGYLARGNKSEIIERSKYKKSERKERGHDREKLQTGQN